MITQEPVPIGPIPRDICAVSDHGVILPVVVAAIALLFVVKRIMERR